LPVQIHVRLRLCLGEREGAHLSKEIFRENGSVRKKFSDGLRRFFVPAERRSGVVIAIRILVTIFESAA
jgi:hypothetical protein